MHKKESLRYKKRQDLLIKSEKDNCAVQHVDTRTTPTVFHVVIRTGGRMVVDVDTGRSKEALFIQLFRVSR